MALPNPVSYNTAVGKMYEIGVKTIASELRDGDVIIHKIPGRNKEERPLYNVCSVRRSSKGGMPLVFLAIGQIDFPANTPEFQIPLDTLVVRLICYVESKSNNFLAKKDEVALEPA